MSAQTALRRRSGLRAFAVVAALCLTGAGAAGAATVGRAGPRPDGTAIIPSGYRVTPAGGQTALGLLPLSLVASPDRRTLLVANAGRATQSLQVVDARTARVRQTISYAAPEALFVGLAFGPDGRRAYASGGPSESAAPETVPNRNDDDAYIWQRLARAGASFRNYGFYVDTDAAGRATVVEPTLAAATDPAYRGFDLSCPDSSGTFASRNPTCGPGRVDEWLREFRQYETAGTLPTVQFVRLPNDHTAGTRAGSPTPKAYVADNDYALGRLVNAVSHSRFWDSTAIFVTEDDAQNGPDHVDAHRTVALVISPFTQTGRVDSTFYDTASMLRTIELIVGLGPLTQFDTFATPMGPSFTDRPNPASYSGIKTDDRPDRGQRGQRTARRRLRPQNLAAEDRIDERAFNEAIWKSVRGADSPMPAPRHALRMVGPALDDDD